MNPKMTERGNNDKALLCLHCLIQGGQGLHLFGIDEKLRKNQKVNRLILNMYLLKVPQRVSVYETCSHPFSTPGR